MSMESDLLRDYRPRQRRPEDQVNNVRLAQLRAQHLKSFEIPDRPGWYWVRGHEVQTQEIDGSMRATFCDCQSWRYRATCKHSERVNMRLGFDLMGG